MRKYHQLLLLIVSVLSLVLFLIYRHEYNRLHYVLQVFNFFGKPCNISDLQQTKYVLTHYDWGPIPVWQEYGNSYIYSAFITKRNEVRAIAMLEEEKLAPRNCYLWFDDKKSAVIGKFKLSKVISGPSSELNMFLYLCLFSDTERVPYAVSFSYMMKKGNDLKKIMLANTLNHQVSSNATVCILPSIYTKRGLMEFLSYHKILGVDSFIFYNSDIPYKLLKIISNLSTRLDLQITFYPWNFPKAESSLTRIIVENDCLLRTFRQSAFVTTLELNEYIVPLDTYNFRTLIKQWEIMSKIISLPVLKFCINKSEITKPISMQNIVFDDNYNGVHNIYKNTEKEDFSSNYVVNETYTSIHKYVSCMQKPLKEHLDKSILKFATDLTRSTLYQFFVHNQI